MLWRLAALALFVAMLQFQPPASGSAVSRSGHARPHPGAASAGIRSSNRTWAPFVHVRELEEFCTTGVVPGVVTDGDRVTSVSRVLLTRLRESFNFSTLNATLRHEFRRLGFAAPPQPTAGEVAAWAVAGVRPGADERSGLAEFLRYAVMFCRSAALVMDSISTSSAGAAVGSSGRTGGGSGSESGSNSTGSVRWDFCRRVGFVHIPKTGGTSVMHVLTRAALQHSRRLLLTANSLFIGFRSNYPQTRKPFKNHHPALRQVRCFISFQTARAASPSKMCECVRMRVGACACIMLLVSSVVVLLVDADYAVYYSRGGRAGGRVGERRRQQLPPWPDG